MTAVASILKGRVLSNANRADAWRILLWACIACAIVELSVVTFDSVWAQEIADPDVHVSITADPEELTVGDLATLTLEVIHPSDHIVVLPRLGPEWGPFEVQLQTPAQTDSGGDGISTTRKRFRVALFAPGEYETPSLPLTVRAADGSVSLVSAPATRLTVRSVLSGADDALRDIRSPADLSESFWDRPAVRVLVSLFALGSLGKVAYMLYRRFRGDAATPEPVMDTRTPREIATQELDRIERLDLPGRGQFKEHYTLVSAVLRARAFAKSKKGVGCDGMEVSDGTLVNAAGRIQPAQKATGRDHGPTIQSWQGTSTGWSIGADDSSSDVWSTLIERDLQIRRHLSDLDGRIGVETQSIGGYAVEAAANGVGVRSA